jgi:hypothetical protein
MHAENAGAPLPADASALPLVGASLVQAKEAAQEEAATFKQGEAITASAPLAEVIEVATTATTGDSLILQVAADADVINEEKTNCCKEGGICCGAEIGCIPILLAPQVQCPDQNPKACCPA